VPKRVNRIALVLAVFAGLATLSAAASAQIIQNGSFQNGNFSFWNATGNFEYVCTPNCPSGIPSPAPPAFSGSGNHAILGSNYQSPGTLSQTFTVPAGTYDLSFLLASGGNGSGTAAGQNFISFKVSVNGAQIFALTNPAPFGFTRYDTFFTSNGTSPSTVLFSFRNDPDWFGLTQINVTPAAAPVPGAGALSFLALGLFLSGSFCRKRVFHKAYKGAAVSLDVIRSYAEIAASVPQLRFTQAAYKRRPLLQRLSMLTGKRAGLAS
jgi:hypothetical protein